jgi:fatty acid desaturase
MTLMHDILKHDMEQKLDELGLPAELDAAIRSLRATRRSIKCLYAFVCTLALGFSVVEGIRHPNATTAWLIIGIWLAALLICFITDAVTKPDVRSCRKRLATVEEKIRLIQMAYS